MDFGGSHTHAHMHEKFTDGHLAPLSLQPKPPAVTLGKPRETLSMVLCVLESKGHHARHWVVTMPDAGWWAGGFCHCSRAEGHANGRRDQVRRKTHRPSVRSCLSNGRNPGDSNRDRGSHPE